MGVNKKYTETKKNGGNIPPVYDKRALAIPYGCGNCIECRKQKARNWQLRLLEDIREHRNGIFVSLTFSTESLLRLWTESKERISGYERDNWIARRAVKLWRERWRKEYGTSPRHWLITELGGGRYEHIHLHGIIWTPKVEALNWRTGKLEDITKQEIRRTWAYGFIWAGDYVNEKTVNYIIKYVHKMDEKHKAYKAIVLNSAGIGESYIKHEKYPYCEQWTCMNPRTRKWYVTTVIKYEKGPRKPGRWEKNKFKEGDTDETYRTRQGLKMAMPAYWRNKIYSDEEREMLWMNLLDKGKRYVCGEEIDIKDGEEKYYKLLKHHQQRNKQLGYGEKEVKWERKVYEEQRRNAIWEERVKQETTNAGR